MPQRPLLLLWLGKLHRVAPRSAMVSTREKRRFSGNQRHRICIGGGSHASAPRRASCRRIRDINGTCIKLGRNWVTKTSSPPKLLFSETCFHYIFQLYPSISHCSPSSGVMTRCMSTCLSGPLWTHQSCLCLGQTIHLCQFWAIPNSIRASW